MAFLDNITPGVGALGAGLLGFIGQDATNSANQAASQEQMDFQERMSNTAYQRQVQDMEVAGLNPMLAYVKGGGASTPSGSMPTYQNSASSGVQAGLQASQAYKTSAEVAKVGADIDNTIADTALKVAQSGKTDADTTLVNEMVKKTTADISKIGADIDYTEASITNLVLDRDRVRAVVRNLGESSALMAQQGMTEPARRANLAASTAKLKADGKISQAEYDAMERTGFVGTTAREVKVLSDVGSEWVDKFLPWKQGKSVSTEDTQIIRDSQGREVGRSSHRSKR
jgi:hypothetical protein